MKKKASSLKRLFINMMLFTFISMPTSSIAGVEANNWKVAKKAMDEKLANSTQTQESFCDIIWATLWPWAKKGNLEARALLANDFLMHGRRMPGHLDWLSFYRDMAILTTYSLGSEDQMYKELKPSLLLSYPQSMKVFKDFSKCLTEDKSSKCTEIAIQQKLVPTFEAYANEIDRSISQGNKSICYGGVAFMEQVPQKNNQQGDR